MVFPSIISVAIRGRSRVPLRAGNGLSFESPVLVGLGDIRPVLRPDYGLTLESPVLVGLCDIRPV